MLAAETLQGGKDGLCDLSQFVWRMPDLQKILIAESIQTNSAQNKDMNAALQCLGQRLGRYSACQGANGWVRSLRQMKGRMRDRFEKGLALTSLI